MKIIYANEETFQEEVMNSDKPVLVDFYADWCGPCKMLGQVLTELEAQDDFKIVKVNVDENKALAQEWDIYTIPAIFAIKNGKVQDSKTGFVPKPILEQMMK